ncbi:PH domain-containing protein [Paenibacillus taiwanensis]|uniref:PH domain-containing protein n=1 Tax=Paenibacillus taiwanensis TaxID=401638 RepID=UPI0003FCFB57|nr:PH domain-containing protein [Paenibacillus taiwanensis]
MNEPKRMHPVYMLFNLITYAKALWPLAIILVFKEINWFQLPWFWYAGATVVVAAVLAFGLMGWRRHTYQLEADKLVIRKGVFFLEERSIFYGRIHSVNTEQPLLQRILGVVQLKIELPGGKADGDGVLPAISAAESIRLQAWIREQMNKAVSEKASSTIAGNGANVDPEDVLRSQQASLTEFDSNIASGDAVGSFLRDDVPQQPKQETIFNISGKQIVMAAFTSINIGLVMTFIAGVISLADDILPKKVYERTIEQATELLPGWWGMAIVGFILAWLLSALLYIVKYGKFRVTREGTHIAISYGLIEKKAHTFQAERVQAVIFKESLLQQAFGYGKLMLHVVSSSKQEMIVLHPFMRKQAWGAMMSDCIPHLQVVPIQTQCPPRAKWFFLRIDVLIVMALCTAAIGFWREAGLWSLLIVPLTIIWDLLQHRDTGMTLSEKQITLQCREIARSTYIVPRSQMVSIVMKGTVFQRRRKLLSLNVKLMGDIAGTTWAVKHMEQADVERVYKWFSRRRHV